MATKAPKSGIPDNMQKFFKKYDMTAPHVVFHIASFMVWSVISWILVTTFLSMHKADRDASFLLVLGSFLSFPFIAFSYKLLNLHRMERLNLKPEVPSDFGVCFTPWSDLSDKEKSAGIVGSIDLKCQKTQQDYIYYTGTEIQSKAYTIVYTIFTLTLLFYPLPAGIPFARNNLFKKVLMKLTIFVSLVTLSAPILMTNRWSSLFLETLYSDLLLMNVDILMILMAYVIFKVRYLSAGKAG